MGANGLPVAQGVVRWFDLNAGIGMIARDGTGDEMFFHFTALPGQGYRTIRAGTAVKFELVEGSHGLTARNIQVKSVPKVVSNASDNGEKQGLQVRTREELVRL